MIVLTDYRGLNVAEMNKMRRLLQQEGVKYRCQKHTDKNCSQGNRIEPS